MNKLGRLSLLLAASALIVACGLLPTPQPTLPPHDSETPEPPLAVTPTNTSEPPPTDTPTPSQTPPPPITPTDTPVPMMDITVYFTDQDAYIAATLPYEVGVTRSVPYTVAIANAVLTQFFNGPTAAETAAGLVLITSGATGFNNLTINDTVARVHLTGNCNSQGATYTIGSLLYANLMQFGTVSYVKIYDQNGSTEQPLGYTNSIPFCLEP
jgi:hypothetical protein